MRCKRLSFYPCLLTSWFVIYLLFCSGVASKKWVPYIYKSSRYRNSINSNIRAPSSRSPHVRMRWQNLHTINRATHQSHQNSLLKIWSNAYRNINHIPPETNKGWDLWKWTPRTGPSCSSNLSIRVPIR